MKIERKSNLDLLRIISILFVLGLHYLFDAGGGVLNNDNVSTINTTLSQFIGSAFIVAVNVFVITSGYFMIDKNEIRIRKIIEILLTLLFYDIVIYIILLCTGICNFDKETIKTFLLSFINNWFIVIYILLYLLSPFINKLFKVLDKRQVQILLTVLLIFFSVWPTFLTDITVRDGGYGIINFIILYLLGGYIKTYNNKCDKKFLYLIGYLLFTIIIAICSTFAGGAWNYNCIFVILSSLCLFLFFKSIDIQHNKSIQYMASFSLGVYIIHTNPFIMKYIYQNIFKTIDFYTSNYLVLHLFVTILIIFGLCIILDSIRKFVFSQTIDKILNKIKCLNLKIKI